MKKLVEKCWKSLWKVNGKFVEDFSANDAIKEKKVLGILQTIGEWCGGEVSYKLLVNDVGGRYPTNY